MPATRFTAKTVAALNVPPGKADLLAWDAMVKGFGAKISAGGSRKWIVQFRPADQRGTKRMTIGDITSMSLDDAREKAKGMLADVTKGHDPHAARAAAKAENNLTVSVLMERYLRHCEAREKPQRSGTLYLIKLYLGRHWQPLHQMPANALKLRDVAARLDKIAEDSGGVTANRCRAALSAVFSWAVKRGLVDSNPVAGTDRNEERPRERVLSETELAAIWSACRNDSHGRILKLLILTGQRRDEVGGLTDAELDLDAATWTLPGARAKNGATHVIPLSPLAVDILRTAPRLDGRAFIFGAGNGPFSGWSRCKRRIDDRIAKALKAPLPAWTLHDLRRSTATHLADVLGVAPHLVETLLNHRSGVRGGVGAVYNRGRYLTELREALDRWAEHVAGITAK